MFFKFLLLTLAALATANAADEKLKFSFYITSQCRDTINFVNNQLTATYAGLGEYLDIEFIPWGKSRREGDNIICQFGPTDCVANKIQSCVLDLLDGDQPKMMEYISCEMRNLFAPQQNYQCANNVGITTDRAKACFESEHGDQLEAKAEEKTKTITMVFVPTIVHNDVYDVDVQNEAYRDFRRYVCGFLEELDLEACLMK